MASSRLLLPGCQYSIMLVSLSNNCALRSQLKNATVSQAASQPVGQTVRQTACTVFCFVYVTGISHMAVRKLSRCRTWRPANNACRNFILWRVLELLNCRSQNPASIYSSTCDSLSFRKLKNSNFNAIIRQQNRKIFTQIATFADI